MSPAIEENIIVELARIRQTIPLQVNQLVAVRFLAQDKPLLKRVLAIPGDRVDLKDGQFHVNGQQIRPMGWPPRFRLRKTDASTLKTQLKNCRGIVPKGRCIVLGKSPLNSLDSLDLGFIECSQIIVTVPRTIPE